MDAFEEIKIIIRHINEFKNDDNEYFVKLKNIIRNNDINIKKTMKDIVSIDNIKYKKSYELLLCKCEYDICVEKLENMLNIFDKMKTKIINLKNKSLDDKCYSFTTNIIPVIRSYNDKKYISGLKTSAFIKDNSDNSIYEQWIASNSLEIKERLLQMVNMFGVSVLKKMDVIIISHKNFNEMSYNDKMKYYMLCCKKLFKYMTNVNSTLMLYKTHLFTLNNIINDNDIFMDNDSDDVVNDTVSLPVEDSDTFDAIKLINSFFNN